MRSFGRLEKKMLLVLNVIANVVSFALQLTAEWVAAAAGEGREKGFILRGGIPPKKGKKGKK